MSPRHRLRERRLGWAFADLASLCLVIELHLEIAQGGAHDVVDWLVKTWVNLDALEVL